MILLDEFLQIADVSIEEYQPPKYAGVGESYNVIFHSFRYFNPGSKVSPRALYSSHIAGAIAPTLWI